MTIQFAPKTVTLVANVQNTLTWGLADFARTLGQDHGIIRDQISLSFQAVNNTGQVCYIGLSYSTVTNTFNVSDRKSIAAVPANGSLNITPLTTPSLAIIGPDILSIQMTLLSAAAGTIVVNLQADTPQPSNGGGNTLFGLDDRSISDYLNITLVILTGIAPGFNASAFYIVPPGKRVIVESFFAYIPQTPVFDEYIEVKFIYNFVSTYYVVKSSSSQPISIAVATRFLIANETERIEIQANCLSGTGGSFIVNAVCTAKEVF